MARITINVSHEGKIETDFEGFEGESCFAEADKLNVILKSLGVGVSSKIVTRKVPEKQAVILRDKSSRR